MRRQQPTEHCRNKIRGANGAASDGHQGAFGLAVVSDMDRTNSRFVGDSICCVQVENILIAGMADRTTYSKQVIEIADYIFKNPNEKVQSVVALFCTKLHKSERTVKTYIRHAKEYNKTRIQKQENARNEVLTAEAKESFKQAILTRNEALKILSNIASGKARKIKIENEIDVKIGQEIIIPTDADRTRAIQQLSKMEGWEAPVKTAQTDTQGNDMERAEIKVTVIQTPFKLAGNEDELDV